MYQICIGFNIKALSMVERTTRLEFFR